MVVSKLDFVGLVLTTLGHDVNHTVGSLVTIESCCSSILQHVNILYFLRRKISDVTLDTIHQNQRRRTIKALQTSNIEGRLVRGIVTCALKGCQTKYTTAEQWVADVLGRTLVELIVGSTGNRHGRLAYVLLDAKTQFYRTAGIIHYHLDLLAAIEGNGLLRLVWSIDNQLVVGTGTNLKGAILIGISLNELIILNFHQGTRDRITHLVDYHTTDITTLSKRRGASQKYRSE